MPEHPHRILIADDREENRYIMGRILRGAGYECSEASTGAETLERVQHQPDLVILDVRLPDMFGFDICRKLKGEPQTASIPILQISAAFVSVEDRVRSLDAGADGYLTHPIDRTMLVATVASLLRLRDAEQKARKAADQWAATFDALSEGLAIVDEGSRLIRWNTAFEALLGTVFHPEVGKDLGAFLAGVGADDAAEERENRDRSAIEFSLDGRIMQFSINAAPSGDDKRERIIVLSDITDRRLAEYAVRTAEKLAATGKLANAIAHEINNPLEALTNLIFLAKMSSDMELVQDLLGRAAGELDRIARITKQTLAFHRETQKPGPIDLAQLLAEVIALYERPSSARRIHLVIDAKPTPPVLGYPGQLSQVFANLVRNAAEAAPSDSTVVVRVRPTHRSGREEARVTIHDQGSGIPRAVQQQMFDPFFTTKELKGSGLGLWVSKSLIAKHRGAIRFRTSERNGTTFAVYLPITAGSETEAAMQESDGQVYSRKQSRS